MVDRDDVELGEEPVEVERRARAGVVVSVRLSADEAERVFRLAEVRGTTVSSLAREAVARYLRSGAGADSSAVMWTGVTTNFASLTIQSTASAQLGTRGDAQQTPVPEHSAAP